MKITWSCCSHDFISQNLQIWKCQWVGELGQLVSQHKFTYFIRCSHILVSFNVIYDLCVENSDANCRMQVTTRLEVSVVLRKCKLLY